MEYHLSNWISSSTKTVVKKSSSKQWFCPLDVEVSM